MKVLLRINWKVPPTVAQLKWVYDHNKHIGVVHIVNRSGGMLLGGKLYV